MCLSVCASAGVWEYIWGNVCCVRVYCMCSNVPVCLYKGVNVVLSVCESVWVWDWMCKSVCAQTWLCCVPVIVWRCKYVFTSLHMCGSTWACVCTWVWRPTADSRILYSLWSTLLGWDAAGSSLILEFTDMTNPATQLSYRLCSLCPVTGDFCSIAFPLLPHLVFYTSENSANVSAVIQGRDSRVIFFSFLSPPKSNKSASLLVPLPERTCSIPTAPLLPPPPHPLMSHSRPALLPWLASCNLLSMQESGKSL